jgi:hypothetical protein
MKQNKFWLFSLFALLKFCTLVSAQNTKVDFTFKVKKKTEIKSAEERAQIPEGEKKEIKDKAEAEKLKIIQSPKLISGEFGLLRVMEFDPTKFNLEKPQYKYVIFSYVVGKNGKAKDIIFERANDLEIKNVLYKSLLGSDWLAAKNSQNQPTDFLYSKQIFIAPLKSFNHEDLGD